MVEEDLRLVLKCGGNGVEKPQKHRFHFGAKFDSWYKQPLRFSCQVAPKCVKLGLGRGRLRGMIGSNLGV